MTGASSIESAGCVAVIPARGGSKGVPRKNVRDLAGLPLVAHTIRAALAAKHVARVVVSTDDAEIAAVARRFGAEVVERPAELSGDTASSESALRHALEVLSGERPPLVMMLQCTSPLTTARDLDEAVETLLRSNADSCFTAVPFFHFLWREGEGGEARGVNHDGKIRKRRQDLEPQYLENGAVYVMRTARFLEEGTRFCGKTVMCAVDAERLLEIDDPVDFVKAEAVMRFQEADERARLFEDAPSAVIFDFDGVLTDNRVIVDQDGRESATCDRGDGMGIGLLAKAGVPMLILSKERNPVVSARARKLDLECLQGVDDKLPALRQWLGARGLDIERAVYVGNDINDLECMRAVGLAVCPSDAHEEAKRAAGLILDRPGGQGAVRELCDLILRGRA
jgi:N-acylneuraminate cytidylyltransferase